MTKKTIYALGALAFLAGAGWAQKAEIPFDQNRWDLAGAKVVDHLGRPALMGTAVLKDVEFGDGAIAYDVAVTGARSYPGAAFRVQPDGSWERFYIRPHRSGRIPPSLYSDVLQYVPSWNGVDSWQLYSGPGYTAGAVIPSGKWFHVKIEVSGDRARVFLEDGQEAALEIPKLRHGIRKGGIRLMGPADGTAFFSRFTVDPAVPADFGHRPPAFPSPGFIRNWMVSQALPTLELDDEGEGLPAAARNLQWRGLAADENGLVDVARIQGRTGQPDTVFLKTTIEASKAGIRAFRIGYSDAVTLYLNGVKIFGGDSSYQGRDPSFLGILGLNDIAYLPLRAGANELLASLSEISGGWGLRMREVGAEYRAGGLARLWKTGKRFGVPESAAYDAARQAVYVSDFNPFRPSGAEGIQVIRRIGLRGGEPEVLTQGLRNPTGLVVRGDVLYAVEAKSVVEIALPSGTITRRIPIPGALRLNDIDADSAGTLYISDPPQGVIFRVTAGQAEPWLKGPEVARPNGVCLSGGRLVWANNGDSRLKAADLIDKSIITIADLAGGIIDGVANGPDGDWLVSHNEGRLFRVGPRGDVALLLDLTADSINIADFSYITDKNLVVYPTFYDGRVAAERLTPGGAKK